MKKLTSWIIVFVMLITVAAGAAAESTNSDEKASLIRNICNTAATYFSDGNFQIYRDTKLKSIGDSLPASFDLRYRGVVPAIRSQGDWGTCWAFAAIAASEISLLSALNMTTEDFLEATGIEMDLSEKHLTWFGNNHLPTLESYAEGEYPYDTNQAGEGLWFSNEDTQPSKARYSYGGTIGYVSSVFANEIGPAFEVEYPYQANDGSSSVEADWTLPQEARYQVSVELINSSILPNPAMRDQDGTYRYNEAGTEAIKQELLAGRAVSIQYHADKALSETAQIQQIAQQMVKNGIPNSSAVLIARINLGLLTYDQMTEDEKQVFAMDYLIMNNIPEEMITKEQLEAFIQDELPDVIKQFGGTNTADTTNTSNAENAKYEQFKSGLIKEGIPEDNADVFARVICGLLTAENMTAEEKEVFITLYLQMNEMTPDMCTQEEWNTLIGDGLQDTIDKVLAAFSELDETNGDDAGEEAGREACTRLGVDFDAFKAESIMRKEAEAIDYFNYLTGAQYTNTHLVTADHIVTIIGWDDDYDISNFLEGKQPPAPGAWIVRNSWGEDWGNDGYFYLSYYDQSISFAESFEYELNLDAEGGVHIASYDNMPASSISSVHQNEPVYLANIFPVAEESVISHVSVLTTDLNARTTVSVYLLSENYTSPTDGTLLDIVTADYEFGGYHRIALNHSYLIPAGSVISVVEKQRILTDNGVEYAVPYTNGDSKASGEIKQILTGAPDTPPENWNVGCIGKDESFICLNNAWFDWQDIVNEAKEADSVTALIEFDNLNIKAYIYTLDSVNAHHSFGAAQAYNGSAEALICEDCGAVLIRQK